jgi:hypothetical protein
LAVDKHQAGILFNYTRGYFESIAALKAMITGIGGDYIELCNGVSIEVHTNNFRSLRGRSILCAILDEVAFFRDEAFANPDTEGCLIFLRRRLIGFDVGISGQSRTRVNAGRPGEGLWIFGVDRGIRSGLNS